MTFLLATPFLLQAVVMLFDEFYFHHRRGLPRWERIGHPLDTLSVLVCYAYLFLAPEFSPVIYLVLAVFSCLFITKDEFIHKEKCEALEMWLHSLLFVLHPVVLFLAYFILRAGDSFRSTFLPDFVLVQALLGVIFFFYQILRWREADAN